MSRILICTCFNTKGSKNIFATGIIMGWAFEKKERINGVSYTHMTKCVHKKNATKEFEDFESQIEKLKAGNKK